MEKIFLTLKWLEQWYYSCPVQWHLAVGFNDWQSAACSLDRYKENFIFQHVFRVGSPENISRIKKYEHCSKLYRQMNLCFFYSLDFCEDTIESCACQQTSLSFLANCCWPIEDHEKSVRPALARGRHELTIECQCTHGVRRGNGDNACERCVTTDMLPMLVLQDYIRYCAPAESCPYCHYHGTHDFSCKLNVYIYT